MKYTTLVLIFLWCACFSYGDAFADECGFCNDGGGCYKREFNAIACCTDICKDDVARNTVETCRKFCPCFHVMRKMTDDVKFLKEYWQNELEVEKKKSRTIRENLDSSDAKVSSLESKIEVLLGERRIFARVAAPIILFVAVSLGVLACCFLSKRKRSDYKQTKLANEVFSGDRCCCQKNSLDINSTKTTGIRKNFSGNSFNSTPETRIASSPDEMATSMKSLWSMNSARATYNSRVPGVVPAASPRTIGAVCDSTIGGIHRSGSGGSAFRLGNLDLAPKDLCSTGGFYPGRQARKDRLESAENEGLPLGTTERNRDRF